MAGTYRHSINAHEYWVNGHLLRADDIVNNSSVTGTTLSDALDTISASGSGPTITLNGITAQTQTITTGTSGTDFAITSASTTHTFNLPDASATARGVVTTGAQTLAGVKTLSSAPVLGTGTVTVSGNTVTVPAAATTLVGRDTTDTLTNKTLTDNTNSVTASAIKTSGTPVSISCVAPNNPASGRWLVTTTSTTANFATAGGGGFGTVVASGTIPSSITIRDFANAASATTLYTLSLTANKWYILHHFHTTSAALSTGTGFLAIQGFSLATGAAHAFTCGGLVSSGYGMRPGGGSTEGRLSHDFDNQKCALAETRIYCYASGNFDVKFTVHSGAYNTTLTVVSSMYKLYQMN